MEPNNPYQGPESEIVGEQRIGDGAVAAARVRPASHGWLWWKRAWRLVAANRVLWALALFVFFLILFVISLAGLLVPILGNFIPTLFSPVLAAGLYQIAADRWQDQEFELGDLFAGFSRRPGALFMAGLAQMLAQMGFTLVMVLVVVAAFGSDMAAMFAPTFGDADPEAMQGLAMAGAAKIMLVSLVSALIFIPFTAMIWFQAPLVYFGERRAFSALGESLMAVLRNWRPMLWYGVVVLVLSLLVALAFAVLFGGIFALLGQGVLSALLMIILALFGAFVGLVLMAVLTVSVYASFRDIFGLDDEPEATPDL